MSENKPLPPFPASPPEHLGLANSAYWEQYERALKEAYAARLRVAVEALHRLSLGEERWVADEALDAIGPLPDEGAGCS